MARGLALGRRVAPRHHRRIRRPGGRDDPVGVRDQLQVAIEALIDASDEDLGTGGPDLLRGILPFRETDPQIKPILDRGIRFDRTTLEEAAKYALLSLDSTMRSNVTVGPPIDLLAYGVDELEITRLRRFPASDPDLIKIGTRWEQALRQAVGRLPQIRFRARRPAEASQMPPAETIELVEPGPGETAGVELQPQAKPPSS